MDPKRNEPQQAASTGKPPVEPEMNPGDQAPAGTEGSGENICAKCSGTGTQEDGRPCEHCRGTGRVTEGIGGA